MREHAAIRVMCSGLAVSATMAAATGQVGPLSQPFPAVQEVEDLAESTLVTFGPATMYRPTAVTFIGDVNGDGIDDIAIAEGHPYLPRGRGKIYVVFGRQTGPPVVDVRTLDGNNGFETSPNATSLAAIGDVNNDGLDDFAIGSQFNPTVIGRLDAGQVYVVFGRRTGFPPTLRLSQLDGSDGFRIDGYYEDGHLGASMAGPGDINGDGIDDLVVGAPGTPGTPGINGRVSIIFGRDGSSARAFDPVESIESPDGQRLVELTGPALLGRSAAGVEDFNGDGRPDLALGGSGRAYVVFGRGPAEPWPQSLNLAALSADEGLRLRSMRGGVSYLAGASIDAAGDVNGDGLNDLVVGAPDGGTRSYAGAAFVVLGTSEPIDEELYFEDLDGDNGFAILGAEPAFPSFDIGEATGYSVSASGDLNNDGIDDVLIGVPGGGDFFSSPFREGRAYAVFGSTTGFEPSLDLAEFGPPHGIEFRGVDAWDNFGLSVDARGDFNGDGVADLAIGARLADGPELDGEGRAYVLLGRSVCPSDLDHDGALTIFDFLSFANFFEAGDPRADFDSDGELTVLDFLAFQNAFDAGCP